MRWLAAVMAVACVALILLGITGCCMGKNAMLSAYEHVIQFAGQFRLTPAIRLQGVRSFGESRILGAYRAEYEAFDGTEYLFGDTSIHARNVTIAADIAAQDGECTLFLLSGSEPAQVLCEGGGDFRTRWNCPPAAVTSALQASASPANSKLKLRPRTGKANSGAIWEHANKTASPASRAGSRRTIAATQGPVKVPATKKAAFLQINRLRAKVYRAEAEGNCRRGYAPVRQGPPENPSGKKVPAEFPGPRATQSGKNPPFSGYTPQNGASRGGSGGNFAGNQILSVRNASQKAVLLFFNQPAFSHDEDAGCQKTSRESSGWKPFRTFIVPDGRLKTLQVFKPAKADRF